MPDHPLAGQPPPGGASSAWTPPTGHLRQRSITSARSRENSNTTNPFDDGHHAVPPSPRGPHSPYGAALLRAQTSSASLADEYTHAMGKEQAMAMRGDRAEWVPTQQFLRSSQSVHSASSPPSLHGATLGVPARASPSSSTSSLARYNLGADEFSLYHDDSVEADDDFHDPGPKLERVGPDYRLVEPKNSRSDGVFGIGFLGLLNLVAIFVIATALVGVFAGWPIYNWATSLTPERFGAAGIGGTNGSGQVPDLPNFRGLIDKDTPQAALTRTMDDGTELQLVFSDEFNQDGRLFYPGMDPYWEAVDLWYWQTQDVEWHDPGNIYTEGGRLVIELTKEELEDSHNMGYLGGMLQSWNKFCFVGGYIEVSASLPGDTHVTGLWPAAWMMSNIGRAGYGGSLDGTWPYVYDTCDVGTLANQTDPTTGLPEFLPSEGDQYHDDDLSWLSGQRFSRCTCPEETDHPGPQFANGTWKGRGAAEIDILEATVEPATGLGHVSMSAQWAPFNPGYRVINSSHEYVQYFTEDCPGNTYLGGATQQVTSGLCLTDSTTYNSTDNMQTYGVAYTPSEQDGWGTGSITWEQGGEKMWRLSDKAMGPNEEAQIGQRLVTAEPMYIIFNLAMSPNFGVIDYNNLEFPSKFRIDYVRVYQPSDHISVGCDPKSNPTVDYINRNPKLYHDPLIVTYADAGRDFPKNRLIQTCDA
ncbi:hypothetical protein JCM9279_002946 [Rhodotorula babjevae]